MDEDEDEDIVVEARREVYSAGKPLVTEPGINMQMRVVPSSEGAASNADTLAGFSIRTNSRGARGRTETSIVCWLIGRAIFIQGREPIRPEVIL